MSDRAIVLAVGAAAVIVLIWAIGLDTFVTGILVVVLAVAALAVLGFLLPSEDRKRKRWR